MIAGWLLIEIRSTTVYKQILNVFQSDFYFYNFNYFSKSVFFIGGRIDHAHHDSNAFNALYEFTAFDKAISSGIEMTSRNDTMITVTADHSHVFTIGGYAQRGNPIFGIGIDLLYFVIKSYL